MNLYKAMRVVYGSTPTSDKEFNEARDIVSADALQSRFERYVSTFDQLNAEACKQDARDQGLKETDPNFWIVALSVATAAVNARN